MEDDGFADAPLVVGDALVQLAARHPVPVVLGQQLVQGDLLQVEQQRAGVRPAAPLARLGKLVAGGAPAAGQNTLYNNESSGNVAIDIVTIDNVTI